MIMEGIANAGTNLNDTSKFDITQEMEDAEQRKPWPMGHTAKTLFRKPDLRMLLVFMDKHAVLKEHHVDGSIAVHILKGAIRLTAEGKEHNLQVNEVVALDASIKHDVQALDDSAFLITIAWPSADKLQSMEHRGYGSCPPSPEVR